MIALIEGVLDYSKIDSEPVEFKIDLDVLVNNMLDDLRTIIISKNVEVQLGELGEIKGNETQIRQLFQNLISNAIKFQADETPKVIIDKRIVGGGTSYFVEDNGIGIEPAFRNSIFMMFKRVNNYGKYPGQGIGLSMCKRVIESHGGRIWIESNDENKPGSRFCFTIASD
jgi:light-regulated signal transduction histidine kinase (bacteriophytochrome)